MSTAWLFTVPGLCSTSSVRSQWVNYDLDLGFTRQNFFIAPYVRGVGEPLDMSWKGCQLIYDFGRHLILDLELYLRNGIGCGWVLLDFLRWRPPSTMWVGSLFFVAITGNVWIIPPFQIWVMCCMLSIFHVSSLIVANNSESPLLSQ